MRILNSIAIDKLVRLIGTPGAPTIIDIRSDEAFATDPRFIPGSTHRAAAAVANWAPAFSGQNAIIVCDDGHAASQGGAAWLRPGGVAAEALKGGFNGWRDENLPLVPETPLPPRDTTGRTVWVTRARPKVERITSPCLIRQFADPQAVFLYVPPPYVLAVAKQFGGAAYDLEGDAGFWSHRGERCTFDLRVEGFGLGGIEPLARGETQNWSSHKPARARA